MTLIEIDERVQLMEDIPELGLHRGDVGLVCSTWFSSTPACYEVEFRAERSTSGIRALLMSKQLGEVQAALQKQLHTDSRPSGPMRGSSARVAH